jgi:hypothetical protein
LLPPLTFWLSTEALLGCSDVQALPLWLAFHSEISIIKFGLYCFITLFTSKLLLCHWINKFHYHFNGCRDSVWPSREMWLKQNPCEVMTMIFDHDFVTWNFIFREPPTPLQCLTFTLLWTVSHFQLWRHDQRQSTNYLWLWRSNGGVSPGKRISVWFSIHAILCSLSH